MQTDPDPVALVRQAQAHIRRREFPQAERLLLQSIPIFQATAGEDDLNYSVCLNNLGMLYHVLGDDDRAEPLLRQVVEVRRRVAGDHPLTLNALRELADFHRSRDDAEQAAAWQRQADAVEARLAAARTAGGAG
jgi:tetratricopeptide (TPR) repeat protein